MNKKYILLGLLIGLSLIFGLSLLIQSSKGTIQDSYNYTWNENIIYESENSEGITPNDDYNIRNKGYYTQDYKATFDFRNDIGKINSSIPLISKVENGAYVEVLDNIDGHDSVLYLDTSIVDKNIYGNFYFYDLEGSIDFWIMKNCTTDTSTITLYDDLNPICVIYFKDDGNYWYLDDSAPFLTDTGYVYLENCWIHMRIDWYSDNTFDLSINGGYIIDGMNCFGTMTHGINRISFWNTVDSCFYLDAFGIDDAVYDGIDYYDIYDNLIPEQVILDDLEVDKFEFDTYNYDSFENNEYSITSTEAAPFLNDIFLNEISDLDTNIIWNHIPDASTSFSYIDLDVGLTDNIINFSVDLNLKSYPTSEVIYFYFYPYNFIGGNPIQFKIGSTHYLTVYDFLLNGNFGNIFVPLSTDITINCYINYIDNLGYLTYDFSDTVTMFNIDDRDDSYDFYGLENFQIVLYQVSMASENYIEFQNIGIYNNNTSFKNNTENFGVISYDINSELIPIINCNLLDININQDYLLYNYNDFNSFFLNGNNFLERNNYTNLNTYNLVNDFTYLYTKLIFLVYDNVSYPTYLKLEGLYLSNDISNYYIQTYSYFHSDNQDNYFYVNNNKLYYYFNNSLESNPEFMSISFYPINYLILDNYSIGFNSYITNNYSCELQLNYNDLSYSDFIINKSNSVKYSQYNLTAGLYITNLVITVSVDDFNTAIGYSNGYIDAIQLGVRYNVFDNIIDNLDDSLLELDFLEGIVYVIIILIFLIIPCYLVYERYGKKVVIPMFILIVIVLMISTFLPIWLSLILLVSSFLFLYHTSKRDDFND